MDPIKLANDTISKEQINELCAWLQTNPRLTQGEQVREFEMRWSKYIFDHYLSSYTAACYSVFVNSGSSALLLAYNLLKISAKNNKVIVPGLAWATDLAPVIQLGMEPILCDCNLDDLSLDLDHLEKLLEEHDPGIVTLVSVLGLVPDMNRIMDLKNKYDFLLLEDVCESFGSKYKKQNLGSFGDLSVFSLFYGHHLSTIEGGMICSYKQNDIDLLRMLRSHGWARELNAERKAALKEDYNINDFDEDFTFYIPGYNVRGTEFQAHLGLMQLNNAQSVTYQREKNYKRFLENLECEWKPKDNPENFTSNFAYPIIDKNRIHIIEELKKANVETRPLICGNLGAQPFYTNKYGHNLLPNCTTVQNYGLYVPNSPHLKNKEIDRIIEAVNQGCKEQKS